MWDNGRSVVISFNGEIYNYRELRRELEGKGYQFVTDSDTEVLIQLYRDRGSDMVRALRGMFAFVIWDPGRRRMLLARDPFGIKPLYFADDGNTILVASEVKALVASGAVDRSPEPAGHVGFFLWGHVPEPFTLFRSIRALPAGSTMCIDADGVGAPRQYTNLSTMLSRNGHDSADSALGGVQDQLREAMLDTVRHHLIADVEVGVFLSSGLDSATLTGLATEIGGRLKTVTLGFAEFRGLSTDETPLASAVARHYGTDHRTVWISQAEFRSELPRVIDRMDQPSIDGINTYFVARAAAQAGLKVALSGLGGDELFGGYPSFAQIPRLTRFVRRIPARRVIGPLARAASQFVATAVSSPKYSSIIEFGGDTEGAYLLRRALFLPWELRRVLDEQTVIEGLRGLAVESRLKESTAGLSTARSSISALEGSWYMRNQLLRDTDWASMSHSLEVRVPLVDPVLWSKVAALVRRNPSLDKRAMASTPRIPLPELILDRPKTGFTVPLREWAMNEGAIPPGRGLRSWARYVYEAAA